MSKKMALHEIGQINYWPNSGKFYIINVLKLLVWCVAGVDVFFLFVSEETTQVHFVICSTTSTRDGKVYEFQHNKSY